MVFTNVFNPRAFIIRKHEYRRTLVRQGATLGANATIVCGTTIGRYAFIGAGAVVIGDVPAFALMIGVPARQKGWMCKCAVKLNFVGGKAKCEACGEEYVLEGGAVREAGQKC
jgi:UDP-2-acetamido-3-amino-2,3-dideoxy-glucuronate N-acetyltransferase